MKVAYDTWIASLDADQRAVVQTIMAVVMAMLDERFNSLASDVDRNARRLRAHSDKIAELHTRLDLYEEAQSNAAIEAIEQFAASQLQPDEHRRLVDMLHNLVVEVSELKGRAI